MRLCVGEKINEAFILRTEMQDQRWGDAAQLHENLEESKDPLQLTSIK